MWIQLKEIMAKGQPVAIRESLNGEALLKGRKDILSAGPIVTDLEAKPASDVVEVTGRVSVELEFGCSRCLTPFKQTLNIPFREIFTSKPEVEAQASEDENEIIHLVREDKVELNPYIEENIQLELPLAPVCREDCKGLCPECGTNRNERECGCKNERIDPRLAGLADFFNS
ncbi:DUF177 domain-containing protein [Paenibacillus sp. UNC499MF]|uniref:YceD family protein n=1 Tax=Paenibacillus sp. UNC499MF TaxID=1502751 RepID=UPI0008A08794|nr:DUF177 domain-containing protein [Paenibacillus sp. UNC499MF]SEF56639.1 uncharacterized protein SAMN02799616_00496 [Paenibacillus sp. UNC499MF]